MPPSDCSALHFSHQPSPGHASSSSMPPPMTLRFHAGKKHTTLHLLSIAFASFQLLSVISRRYRLLLDTKLSR